MTVSPVVMRLLGRLGLGVETPPPSAESWISVLESVSKLLGDSDQERYLLERSLSISSREMLERWERLKAMEEFWRTLAECAPDIILRVDSAGKIIFANQDFGAISRPALVGRSLQELLSPDQQSKVEEAIRSMLSERTSPRFDVSVVGRDGAPLYYSCRAAPVNQKGEVVAGVIVATDMSDTRRLEDAVETERAKSFQVAKLAALGEMAGGIAHEINNPAATIQLIASQLRELIEEGELSVPLLSEMSSTIEKTIVQICEIVRSLRTLSRNTASDPFVRAPVRQVVSETLAVCQMRFKGLAASVEVGDFPADLSVECRPIQISQIILNLLNNACDAIESLPDKWVRIEVGERAGNVEISVTDSGKGIPAHLRDKVAQPFFTTKVAGKGTGLGLSVSRGIADAHRGTLELDPSCPNTRFVIRLPKAQPSV